MTETRWTRFMDMHSGGGCKEDPYDKILIEAPEDEARVIFYNRFSHSPDRVTCTCCGEDYSVTEHADLSEATAYDRNCDSGYVFADDGTEVQHDGNPYSVGEWDAATRTRRVDGRVIEHRYFERPNLRYGQAKHWTVEEYLAQPNVLVIRANEIKPEERRGSVPAQGYVWMD